MANVFIAGFTHSESGGFTLQNFRTIFTQIYPYKIALNNSLFVGVMGAILPFIIALPLAYLVSKYEFRSKTLLITIISISMLMPAFVGAYFWVILLGRYGIITGPLNSLLGTSFSIYGQKAILWAFMWGRYPLVFLFLYPAFSTLNPELEEAAQTLGANSKRTFFSIFLPMLVPAIVNAAYMSFIMSITDMGTPLVIGGDYLVLPTLLYQEFMTEVGSGRIPMAGAVGILLLLINVAVLFGGRYYITRRRYESVSARRAEPKKLSGRGELAMIFGIWAVVGWGLLPWVFAILGSFIEWGRGGRAFWNSPTLDNYRMVFTNPTLSRGVSVTIFLTVVSLAMMIIAGLLIAYILVKKRYPVINRALDILVSIPLIIPGAVLALGYVMFFSSPPIILTGTWIILALCFFVRRLPHITRSIESTLYSISDAYEESSLNLGAPPMKTFRKITVRMLMPGVISGATLAFLFTVGTFSATIILYTAPWTTLPILIYQNTMANTGIAAALSIVMLLIGFVPLLIINRLTHGGIKIAT
ncbi:MAG: iron ABC transporter permease [Thermodesulfobacteriota bacterium]